MAKIPTAAATVITTVAARRTILAVVVSSDVLSHFTEPAATPSATLAVTPITQRQFESHTTIATMVASVTRTVS